MTFLELDVLHLKVIGCYYTDILFFIVFILQIGGNGLNQIQIL